MTILHPMLNPTHGGGRVGEEKGGGWSNVRLGHFGTLKTYTLESLQKNPLVLTVAFENLFLDLRFLKSPKHLR